MRPPILLLIGIALALPAVAQAQPEGMLPRLTHLPASTRAMALGNSYAVTSGHADAIFYHPALLRRASGMGFGYQRWGGNSSSVALSTAVSAFGGGLGFGLRTLQASAFGSGALSAPAGQDALFGLGSVPISERVLTVGYARETRFGIDVGVGLDLVDERAGSARQNVALFDVSVSRDLGFVDIALTVHDFGNKPILTDQSDGPAKVVLGAGGYGRPVGEVDLGFAAHLGFDEDDVLFGGGVEIGYWPIQGRTFVGRLGFQSVPEGSDAAPFTTGFAFWGDDLVLEWAWRPFSDADEGGAHRIGVRWR